MNQLLCISAAFLIATTTVPAQLNVPKTVESAFSVNHPNAGLRKWKQHDGIYFASYREAGKRHTAYYDATGKWEKTESKITWTKNLPPAIRKSMLNKGFMKYYVMDMKKVETADKTIYTVHINDGNMLDSDHHDAFTQYFVLQFSETGELINKTEVEN